MNRRNFIRSSAVATSGLSIGLPSWNSLPIIEPATPPGYKSDAAISIFSKNLHWLNYNDMAAAVKDMGFDGVDLTVRPGGHVLPEQVAIDLPKAVSAIRKKGLEVYTITTAIMSTAEPYTEAILKTASTQGIKYYRLGWFTYDNKISIPQNIQVFKERFLQLQELNIKYRIHGAYQNHAGSYFGAPVLDLWMALQEMDPQYVGCQYDIRHATAEGANSWPIGLSLLKDYIKTINIKDFLWMQKDGHWKDESVPMGKGMVDFKKYLQLMNDYNYKGPISVHYEYPLGGAENGNNQIALPKEEILAAMKRDLDLLKTWL